MSSESDGERSKHLNYQFPNKPLVFKLAYTNVTWHWGYVSATASCKELRKNELLWLLCQCCSSHHLFVEQCQQWTLLLDFSSVCWINSGLGCLVLLFLYLLPSRTVWGLCWSEGCYVVMALLGNMVQWAIPVVVLHKSWNQLGRVLSYPVRSHAWCCAAQISTLVWKQLRDASPEAALLPRDLFGKACRHLA